MIKKTNAKASSQPGFLQDAEAHTAAIDLARPASNASQPLEKSRVRVKALADQATLQDKGADALPVSDYPLKQGPTASNAVDVRQRSRERVK